MSSEPSQKSKDRAKRIKIDILCDCDPDSICDPHMDIAIALDEFAENRRERFMLAAVIGTAMTDLDARDIASGAVNVAEQTIKHLDAWNERETNET